MEKVFEIYIRTTPERLWEAITDPEIRSQVQLRRRGRLGVDRRVALRDGRPGAGVLLGEGEILEVEPPRRLVQTMVALWGDDVEAEGTSRVTWEIEPVADSCRLTVTHDQLREGANDQLYGGWPMILSGLKTWLETGELLTTPGSLLWAGDPGLTSSPPGGPAAGGAPGSRGGPLCLHNNARLRIYLRNEGLP